VLRAVEPSLQKMIVCAIAAAVLAIGVWWIVAVRSAPPPVPEVVLPVR
jgi:hypothetical protein